MKKTDKKILVTGGAGYIGSVLVYLLLHEGYKVRVLDNLRWGGESLLGVYHHPNFDFVYGDVRQASDIMKALFGINDVVHLAAIVGDPACKKEPELARQTNLEASKNLFDRARENGIERFVFASTCSNYGKMADPKAYVDETSPLAPISLYAELKVAFERFLFGSEQKSGFVPVALRFATVYGLSPRMRFDLTVNEFARDLFFGKELQIFGEQFWRPYCHVQDLARACMLAIEAPETIVNHEVFNVGDTGENYQKKMIVDEIRKYLPEAKVEYVKKDEDPRDYKVDFSKIRDQLGFSISRKLPDGIGEIINVFSKNILKEPYSVNYQNI